MRKSRKSPKQRKKKSREKIEINHLYTVSIKRYINSGRKDSPWRLKNWFSHKNTESVDYPKYSFHMEMLKIQLSESNKILKIHPEQPK